MRVALVYDRVNKIGGAERVLEVLHEIFPQASLYTAVYNPSSAPWAKKFKVIPSFLNKFPLAKSHHEFYPWLTPLAFENFDFSQFEVVISITSADAKGIITKPTTLHICYCLTPTRYLWSGYGDYFRDGLTRFLTKPVVSYLRGWDKIAAQRPDVYVAISKNVQKRIKKYYGRESEVIYPPMVLAEVAYRNFDSASDSLFLVVSRLVPYKRVDIAIRVFNELGLPLKIVGTGSEMRKLRKMAKRNIEFLGQLTDEELVGYYQKCQAVIFPQEEDFGLVPLEAQACGKPVIAFRGGGALETVIEAASAGSGQGPTGLFFYPQTAQALAEAVEKFEKFSFKPEDCQKNAEKFAKEIFKKKFKEFVEEKWKNFLS